MPEIDKIPERLYEPNDPYHWTFDNLPLKNLHTRLSLVNSAVDINSTILREAAGNQGSLSNRLSQIMNNDGTLKLTAVDNLGHSIAKHTDGDGFVRMLSQERNKLANISAGATALKLQLGNTIFDDHTIKLVDSANLTWAINGAQELTLNTSFPLNEVNRHIFNQTAVPINLGSPNYIDYRTTSATTNFLEDSLRVYVNGVRLNPSAPVLVPPAAAPQLNAWKSLSYTPNPAAGTFALSHAITAADVVTVDFITAS